MQEGIKIVLLVRVGGLCQEAEVVSLGRHVVSLGVELVGESSPPSDDDDASVGQDLRGGVPAAVGKVDRELGPLAFSVVARGDCADFSDARAVPASLNEGAVGVQCARGAPRVGADVEGADITGNDVVLEGVGGAVCDGSVAVVGVVVLAAAGAGGEGEVGEAHVRTVEEDDFVVLEELHVHCRDSDTFVEKNPLPPGGDVTGSSINGGKRRRIGQVLGVGNNEEIRK